MATAIFTGAVDNTWSNGGNWSGGTGAGGVPADGSGGDDAVVQSGKTCNIDTIRIMDREHYTKSELDTRFDKLEQTVVREISNVAAKLDKLTDTVTAHISRDERMWQEHFSKAGEAR